MRLLAMIGDFTTEKISKIKRDENNLFDPDSANTIHLTLFGKFIPKKARMQRIKENVKIIKEKQNAQQKNGSI
jgi:hypothetical protein